MFESEWQAHRHHSYQDRQPDPLAKGSHLAFLINCVGCADDGCHSVFRIITQRCPNAVQKSYGIGRNLHDSMPLLPQRRMGDGQMRSEGNVEMRPM